MRNICNFSTRTPVNITASYREPSLANSIQELMPWSNGSFKTGQVKNCSNKEFLETLTGYFRNNIL